LIAGIEMQASAGKTIISVAIVAGPLAALFLLAGLLFGSR